MCMDNSYITWQTVGKRLVKQQSFGKIKKSKKNHLHSFAIISDKVCQI